MEGKDDSTSGLRVAIEAATVCWSNLPETEVFIFFLLSMIGRLENEKDEDKKRAPRLFRHITDHQQIKEFGGQSHLSGCFD